MAEYTRTRTSGSLDSAFVEKYTNTPSGLWPSYVNFCTIPGRLGSTKSISDNPTPNFRKRIKTGEIIMNELMISEVSLSSSFATMKIGPYDDWGVSEISGDLAAMVGALVGRDGFDVKGRTAQEFAVNRAFARMNSSPLMSGEFASDFAKTLSMVRRPIAAAYEYCDKLIDARKWLLKRRKSMTYVKATAQTWLEYRYGWSPLVRDIDEGIEQTQKLRRKHQRRRLVARASEGWTHEEAAPFFSTGYYSWPNLSSYGTAHGSGSGRASAGVIYEVVEPSHVIDRATACLGLRPRDWPATAWEIIPFSFVADWFVGVGDWIQASVPSPGITVLGSWCTRVATWESSSTPELYNPAFMSHPPTIASAGTYSKVERYVIRNVGLGPTTLPPSKSANLSVVQTVDALSLLAASVRGKLRELRH